MDYSSLIVASAIFLILHFVSATNLRENIIAKRGEAFWMIAFSLLSLISFAWMIWAYVGIEDEVAYWAVPDWWRWVNAILLFEALALIILGYLPLITKSKSILNGVTRHPIMWGVGIFSFAHMISNPKPSAFTFFGSLMASALVGSFLLDRRKAQKLSMNAEKVYQKTSWLPFLAIIQGRSDFKMSNIKLWHWSIIVICFVAAIYVHVKIMGDYLLPIA